jgi:hypothetical protein
VSLRTPTSRHNRSTAYVEVRFAHPNLCGLRQRQAENKLPAISIYDPKAKPQQKDKENQQPSPEQKRDRSR